MAPRRIVMRPVDSCSGCVPRPGAGWGLLDHRGRPKVAYHHSGGRWASVSLVWSTDEGLFGDPPCTWQTTVRRASVRALRVALYSDQEGARRSVAIRELELPARGVVRA